MKKNKNINSMSKNRFWMVRAGEGGFLFDQFIKGNFVAIGWNELGDISELNSRDKIKRELSNTYQIEGVKGGVQAGIVHRFVNELKLNDGIITYNPLNRVYKVGTVEGEYKFMPEIEYHHIRKVKWINTINRDSLSQKTKNALGSVLTIFELKENEKKELESFLEKSTWVNGVKIHKDIRKRKLFEEFEGKCAFCQSKLNDIRLGAIEHFYPKNVYPELALDEENLLLVCQPCSIIKANHFPVDKNGYPLLLNPKTDKWKDNIKIGLNGLAEGLTEKGSRTIEFLKLNRESLVENRKVAILAKSFENKISKVNKNYYKNFQDNITAIRQLNLISSLIKDNLQYPQFTMLYSNAITILETYLSDALIAKVFSDKNHLRRFVETYREFKDSKFSISNIFKIHEKIDERANNALRGIMYHNLPKLKGIYKDSIDVIFPDISFLTKAILKRHDFVHRSGKTVNGKIQSISEKDITLLCDKIEDFVKNINEQIDKV